MQKADAVSRARPRLNPGRFPGERGPCYPVEHGRASACASISGAPGLRSPGGASPGDDGLRVLIELAAARPRRVLDINPALPVTDLLDPDAGLIELIAAPACHR